MRRPKINPWFAVLILVIIMLPVSWLVHNNQDNANERQRYKQTFIELLGSQGYKAGNYDFDPNAIKINNGRISVRLTLDGCVGYDVQAVSNLNSPTGFSVILPNGEGSIDGSPPRDRLEIDISTGNFCFSEGKKTHQD